jgi:hypothetical protein
MFVPPRFRITPEHLVDGHRLGWKIIVCYRGRERLRKFLLPVALERHRRLQNTIPSLQLEMLRNDLAERPLAHTQPPPVKTQRGPVRPNHSRSSRDNPLAPNDIGDLTHNAERTIDRSRLDKCLRLGGSKGSPNCWNLRLRALGSYPIGAV